MSDVGTKESLVNTRATRLFIRPTGTDLEYVELQDKSLNPSNRVIVEPSIGAGVVAYTGALDAVLNGTALFSTNMVTAVGGYKEIAPIDTNTFQLPIKTWKIKVTPFSGSQQVWTVKGMLETFEFKGGAEGALKYDIVIRITEFNAATDIV